MDIVAACHRFAASVALTSVTISASSATILGVERRVVTPCKACIGVLAWVYNIPVRSLLTTIALLFFYGWMCCSFLDLGFNPRPIKHCSYACMSSLSQKLPNINGTERRLCSMQG